jgi:hypothetical protein
MLTFPPLYYFCISSFRLLTYNLSLSLRNQQRQLTAYYKLMHFVFPSRCCRIEGAAHQHLNATLRDRSTPYLPSRKTTL